MRKFALFLLRLYKTSISPLLGPSVCRYNPTCSQYTYQAISKYGILHGSWLGFKRILTCHP